MPLVFGQVDRTPDIRNSSICHCGFNHICGIGTVCTGLSDFVSGTEQLQKSRGSHVAQFVCQPDATV